MTWLMHPFLDAYFEGNKFTPELFSQEWPAQSPISPLQSLQNLEYNLKKETWRSIQLVTVLSKKPFEPEVMKVVKLPCSPHPQTDTVFVGLIWAGFVLFLRGWSSSPSL